MGKKNVVISIKPQYSEKIIAGLKLVELRRKFPDSLPEGSVAYIYASSPTKAIVGFAEIQYVKKVPVVDIWGKHGENAYIEKVDFDRYFQGVSFGVVIGLNNPCEYLEPISLIELRNKFDFTPPQSFSYARSLLMNGLARKPINVINNII